MATHSSILAWSIPWTEEPGGLWFTGVTKNRTRLSDQTTISMTQSYDLDRGRKYLLSGQFTFPKGG